MPMHVINVIAESVIGIDIFAKCKGRNNLPKIYPSSLLVGVMRTLFCGKITDGTEEHDLVLETFLSDALKDFFAMINDFFRENTATVVLFLKRKNSV